MKPIGRGETVEVTITARRTRQLVPTSLGEAAVRTLGEGPAVLLAHGYCADHRDWVPVARRLVAAGRTVHLLDLPGHGDSSLAWKPVTLSALADSFGEVVETLDLHDAVLVGHSLGGIALLALSAGRPPWLDVRAKAQVLVATTPTLRMPAELVTLSLGANLWSRPILGIPPLGHLALRITVFGPGADEDQVELVRRTWLDAPYRTRWAYATGLLGAEVSEVEKVRLPTAVVCGTTDRLTPPSRSRSLARRIPGASLHLVPAAGHAVAVERPEEVAKVILELA